MSRFPRFATRGVSFAVLTVVVLSARGHLEPLDDDYDEYEEKEARAAAGLFQPGGPIQFGPPAIAGVDGPILQPLDNVPAQPFTLPPLQTRSVSDLMTEQAAEDAQAPPQREPIFRHEFEHRQLRRRPHDVNAPPVAQWPPSAEPPASLPRPSVPFTVTSFDGPDTTSSGFVPPDSMGDVGPTQYIVALNGRILSYNKNTLAPDGILDVTSNTFFNAVRNAATAVDPRIRFDRHTNRWFVVYISVAVPNRFLIAFSNTANITASTNFSFTFFADTTVNGIGQSCLGDYETLGIDANALYMGTNEFCGASLGTASYFGSAEYVIPKATLLAGGGTMAGFVGNAYFTPQGVDNYDSSSTLGYFVSVDNAFFGVLRLSQIANPATPSPTKTTRSITVLSTASPRSVPHSGGSRNLDGLDDRLMNAVSRNGRIWTAHAICVDATGVATSNATLCRNGVRWYELTDITSAAPGVNQAGTVFDPAVTNPRHYWVPTLNVNAAGVVVMGFASAAANTFAGAAFTQREPTDTLGTTQAVVQHSAGATSYNTGEATTNYRWGDYSMVSVDPANDGTFWTVQEYGKAASTWGTRVSRFVGPSGGAAPTISNILNQAINEDTSAGPIAFTVTDADTPATSLTLSAASSNTLLVPVASVVFGGSGESRSVTISPAPNASGSATITVTVSDGALTASDTFDIMVAPINDVPTISDVANQNTNEDSAVGPVGFVIGDVETDEGVLNVTASSSNTTLVPQANITLGGSGASRTVMVTPAANQSGSATITLNVSDGVASGTDTFTVTVAAVNDAPTIGDVANQSTPEDTTVGGVGITVADVDTALSGLSVVATSSNTTLLPNAGLAVTGTGGARTLTASPAANQSGSTTITVTVSDGALSASDSFVLTVTPVNDAPSIGAIADRSIQQDGSVAAFPLVIGDIDSAEGSLAVNATSNNTGLLPAAGISLGGTGFNRTLALTPAAGQTGSALVTVSVSDGAAPTSTSFTLTVNARTGPPSAPRNFVATLVGTTLNMSWDLPDAGAPPTDYILQVSIDPSFAVLVFDQSTGGAARTMTIGGVPNGIFHLRVRARNGAGTGPPSNTQRIGDPPQPPTSFVATLSGSTLSMTWSAPVNGPAASDYLLEAALNSTFTPVIYLQATGSAATSLSIAGVPPGTFFLRMRARNGSGVSAPSNTQVIGASCSAAPDPASGFTITKLGGLSVRLAWNAPAGANPASDYTIQAALDAGFSAVVLNQPLGGNATAFTAIAPPGSYFVRVVATNACGAASPSNVVNLVMP